MATTTGNRARSPREPPSARDERLFLQLLALTGGRPNRKGMVPTTCPSCGDTKQHFEFNEHWGHCVKCGETIGITRLAQLLGAEDYRPAPPPRWRPRRPPPHYSWLDDPGCWRHYLPPVADAVDYYHGRGFIDESIARWRLGFGILPPHSARCEHPRYILPVFERVEDRDRLVALKGRYLDASQCAAMGHPKWLPAAGSKSVLFAAELLHEGVKLVVTAAPYNAILAMQERPGLVAVAPSNGEGQWRDEWTAAIAAARPFGTIYVCYDNDLAGRLGGAKAAAALRAAGLRVKVYEWADSAPEKADLADLALRGAIPFAWPILPRGVNPE
jgi:hypothetical protein